MINPTINSRINLSLDLANYRSHLIGVDMIINEASHQQKISLPVWTPGSYMIREFSQHIISINAKENEEVIGISKINKNTFMLDNKHHQIKISYQVYAFDNSIRGAYLDHKQCYFNGAALFFMPHGMLAKEYTLTINEPLSWFNCEVASNLTKIDVDERGFGTYLAKNYDELVDHPFQISPMKRLKFYVNNIPHEMVMVGDIRPFDEARLTNDLLKLCQSYLVIFSGKAPFSSYMFITRLEEGGHGGLEHQNSSMLLASPYSLPKKNAEDIFNNNYKNFLSLCSHEYFHAWNVKKLRPRNFLSYDYDQECYTTLLWLFEGITSYYDDLQLCRSRLISLPSYLDIIGKNITKLLRNYGRNLQSLADASFDAWIKFYRPHESSQNLSISYYLKGSLVALMLDLLIRSHSNHKSSLDMVMKNALDKYGFDGILASEFLALIFDISGLDVDWFSQNFIYGTKELDLAPLLEEFGIALLFSKDDIFTDDKTKMQAFLGLKIRLEDKNQSIISFVEQNSPAMLAGLCPNDEIIAINNTRLDASNISELLSSIIPNQSISITYSRKKHLDETKVLALELPLRIGKLLLKKPLTLSQKQNLHSWLNININE